MIKHIRWYVRHKGEYDMHRKHLERTFCWKISGELKLFRYQMMQKEKEDIYHAAYQIDGIISIYELLVEMSGMLSKETLEAAVAFPNLLEFLYEEWLGYEDSQAADIQRCLNKELAKLRMDYRKLKEEAV